MTGGRYYPKPKANVFLTTGCTLLDCALGGGYAQGRMANIVGDRSTGKSLLCIEACANFHRQHPKGRIFYNEVEAAFDVAYAQTVGLPAGSVVEFANPKMDTVQEFARHLKSWSEGLSKSTPGLYILDSLDALDEEGEQARDKKNEARRAKGEEEKGTFGVEKAREMSRMFRKTVRLLDQKNVTLIIVSQVRANIGARFGKKQRRNGGAAMDFYASHVIWLSQLGRIKSTRNGIERQVGIDVRAMIEKNKVAEPFRWADFPIMFNYGIDDVAAGVYWLIENKRGKRIDCASVKEGAALLAKINALGADKFVQCRDILNRKVQTAWAEIEKDFAPPRRKYE